MTQMNKFKKCAYSALVVIFIVSGIALPGIIISMPQPAYSQVPPEPQCVCAECGRPCGSGHATNCSSHRPK